MAGSYRIVAHPDKCLLQINLCGFFDTADVAQFAVDNRAAYELLGCAANRHVTLVNVSACSIQPQSVIRVFQTMLADPRYQARRIAFVVGGSLAKMQVRRLLDGRDGRCFEDDQSATTWLLQT